MTVIQSDKSLDVLCRDYSCISALSDADKMDLASLKTVVDSSLPVFVALNAECYVDWTGIDRGGICGEKIYCENTYPVNKTVQLLYILQHDKLFEVGMRGVLVPTSRKAASKDSIGYFLDKSRRVNLESIVPVLQSVSVSDVSRDVLGVNNALPSLFRAVFSSSERDNPDLVAFCLDEVRKIITKEYVAKRTGWEGHRSNITLGYNFGRIELQPRREYSFKKDDLQPLFSPERKLFGWPLYQTFSSSWCESYDSILSRTRNIPFVVPRSESSNNIQDFLEIIRGQADKLPNSGVSKNSDIRISDRFGG